MCALLRVFARLLREFGATTHCAFLHFYCASSRFFARPITARSLRPIAARLCAQLLRFFARPITARIRASLCAQLLRVCCAQLLRVFAPNCCASLRPIAARIRASLRARLLRVCCARLCAQLLRPITARLLRASTSHLLSFCAPNLCKANHKINFPILWIGRIIGRHHASTYFDNMVATIMSCATWSMKRRASSALTARRSAAIVVADPMRRAPGRECAYDGEYSHESAIKFRTSCDPSNTAGSW